MANNLAFAEKYVTSAIDENYYLESLTGRFFNNGIIGDWVDGKTCHVFNLKTTGLTNYKRGGHGLTNADGSTFSSLETFTLSHERWVSLPIDKLDSVDDMGVVAGHLAMDFNRQHITPEKDCVNLSTLAGYTSVELGNRVVETISANTIIAKFNAAFKELANKRVPVKDQVIFVSTSVMELLRNTTELDKRLDVATEKGSYAGKEVTFDVVRYAGREIIEVPEDLFYTDIVVGDNGFYPSADSKVINFMVVDSKAPVAVSHFDKTKVYDSDSVDLGFYGIKFTALLYYDLFVPENKIGGIYCSVSEEAGTAVASTLTVKAKAGTTGKTIVTKVLTQPANIAYDALYRNTSAVAIGADTSSLTLVELGVEFAPETNTYFVASLGGKAVAVSANYTNLPKGN